ncbi:Uncharacterized protein HZ326_16817 [Fusarium oxysporum f. sp. albedinis]|nr:Uncharacterized protein HZ326_16817 [Fusarium oxysporum f. sp. albedinis]
MAFKAIVESVVCGTVTVGRPLRLLAFKQCFEEPYPFHFIPSTASIFFNFFTHAFDLHNTTLSRLSMSIMSCISSYYYETTMLALELSISLDYAQLHGSDF